MSETVRALHDLARDALVDHAVLILNLVLVAFHDGVETLGAPQDVPHRVRERHGGLRVDRLLVDDDARHVRAHVNHGLLRHDDALHHARAHVNHGLLVQSLALAPGVALPRLQDLDDLSLGALVLVPLGLAAFMRFFWESWRWKNRSWLD